MARRTLEDLKKRYAKGGNGGFGPPKGGGPKGGHGPMGHGAKPQDTKATVRRLWHYVSIYKFRLFLVFVSIFVSVLTSLAATYKMREIVNMIADSKLSVEIRLAYLVKVFILIAVLYVSNIIFTYIQNRIIIGISQKAVFTIRKDLFGKVQKLPLRFYDTSSTGETMSRFTNDVDNIGMMFDNSLISLTSGMLTFTVIVCVMFFINVWLTLVALLFIPIFIKSAAYVGKQSGKYYAEQQTALGAVNGYIEEAISGQGVIKVFSHEETAINEFKLLNEDLREKQVKAQFMGGIIWHVIGNLSQMCYAFIAGIGGVLCITTGFDIGGLTVFLTLTRIYSRPFNEISQQMTTIFAALAGAERVFKIMDEAPETPDEPDAYEVTSLKGHVELKNVTFGYNPDKPVLKNISLYAKPGQKIAFVGSTGAGKTTITNLLNRFYDIQEGEIIIDGMNVKNIKRDVLRSNIAMVLQDTHLFTGTIMENIRYGRLDATDEEVIEAAKVAYAHSFIMRLSNGYNTMISGDGSNLSQGQRQLLNIARAALSKAPILVLDEATSSVDTRTERHIERGMDAIMKDRTTFVIAHRLSTVRNANAIMVLENGEIIERGTHEQLLELKGRYYELYTGKRELD